MLYLGLNNEGLNMLEVPYLYVVVNNQIVVMSTFRKLQSTEVSIYFVFV